MAAPDRVRLLIARLRPAVQGWLSVIAASSAGAMLVCAYGNLDAAWSFLAQFSLFYHPMRVCGGLYLVPVLIRY